MSTSNCCSHDLKLLEFSFLNALIVPVSCFLQLLTLFNFLLPKAWQIGKLKLCNSLHHNMSRPTESLLACTTASHPWFPTSKRLIYLQSLEQQHLWNSIKSPAAWNQSGTQQCLKWVGFVLSTCSLFLLEQCLMCLLFPVLRKLLAAGCFWLCSSAASVNESWQWMGEFSSAQWQVWINVFVQNCHNSFHSLVAFKSWLYQLMRCSFPGLIFFFWLF